MSSVLAPQSLAPLLRQLADRLDDEGDKAMRRAPILAARGWPASVNGSEGGRSSDITSSTERAALNPGLFDDVDQQLRIQLSVCAVAVFATHTVLDRIMSHAADDDRVPSGTGTCMVEGCDHFCNPRKDPEDRLKAGFCPRHHRQWLRRGQPDRGTFIRTIETEDVA